MFSSDGRYELAPFYNGDYIEIYDGQDVIFQGSKEDLKVLYDLIKKGLDNPDNE